MKNIRSIFPMIILLTISKHFPEVSKAIFLKKQILRVIKFFAEANVQWRI